MKIDSTIKLINFSSCKGGIVMGINEMELQNLRHLIIFNETDSEKYGSYAECANDASVKQYFQKASQSATKNKQQLMQFLQ